MATSLMHHGLESAAEKLPDHVAVLAGDDRWTYGELDRAANALAQHLAARGVGRGDRVAVMTSNRPEFVVAVHAASKLGAAPVMLNSSWKALEVGTARRPDRTPLRRGRRCRRRPPGASSSVRTPCST